MPKRNTLPRLPEGENKAEMSCIQKARPLQSLAETGLTLSEFKIIDAYLSKIDSHKPEERSVLLEKGKLEEYLEVDRIREEELEKRLSHLFQTVKIKDKNKPKGFKLVNLFEKAEAVQDENGTWQVTLTCTPSAMEYIFNIENIGYLRYHLHNVVNLTSRYSYVLFLYVIDNKFRGTWAVGVDELRNILNCKSQWYEQFKFFNKEILKKCTEEINAKTDVKFAYEPIRAGRRVTGIKFTVPEEPQAKTEIKTEIPEELQQHLLSLCQTKYPDIDSIRADELVQETLSAMQGRKITDTYKYAETVLKQKADNLRKEKSKRQYAYGRSRDLYAEAASRPQSYDLEEFEKMAVNFAEYIDEPQQPIPEPEPVNISLQSLQEFTQGKEPPAPEPKQPETTQTGTAQEYYLYTMSYLIDTRGTDMDFVQKIAKAEEIRDKIKTLEKNHIPVPAPTNDIIESFLK